MNGHIEAFGVIENQASGDGEEVGSHADTAHACLIKTLPPRTREKAAQLAARINPVNGPLYEVLGGHGFAGSPFELSVTVQKYWGPRPHCFTVSFMETTPADLQARILSHLNAWSTRTGMSFASTSGTGEVRISRGPGGYYSYLGTDIALVPKSHQTMNLQGFTMGTPEAEYRQVVRHEAGHTLGFPHEHMRKELVARIDRAKAYRYFLERQGWSKAMVDEQVLTPLDDRSIFGTAPDQDSIMCYQLPAQITVDGLPIRGGSDINPSDFAFAEIVYPKPESTQGPAAPSFEDDWDPADDVIAPGYEDDWDPADDVIAPI